MRLNNNQLFWLSNLISDMDADQKALIIGEKTLEKPSRIHACTEATIKFCPFCGEDMILNEPLAEFLGDKR